MSNVSLSLTRVRQAQDKLRYKTRCCARKLKTHSSTWTNLWRYNNKDDQDMDNVFYAEQGREYYPDIDDALCYCDYMDENGDMQTVVF